MKIIKKLETIDEDQEFLSAEFELNCWYSHPLIRFIRYHHRQKIQIRTLLHFDTNVGWRGVAIRPENIGVDSME